MALDIRKSVYEARAEAEKNPTSYGAENYPRNSQYQYESGAGEIKFTTKDIERDRELDKTKELVTKKLKPFCASDGTFSLEQWCEALKSKVLYFSIILKVPR